MKLTAHQAGSHLSLVRVPTPSRAVCPGEWARRQAGWGKRPCPSFTWKLLCDLWIHLPLEVAYTARSPGPSRSSPVTSSPLPSHSPPNSEGLRDEDMVPPRNTTRSATGPHVGKEAPTAGDQMFLAISETGNPGLAHRAAGWGSTCKTPSLNGDAG